MVDKTAAVTWLREKLYRANREYREAVEWHARLDMREMFSSAADPEKRKAERAEFAEACKKLSETEQEWLKVKLTYDMIVDSLLRESKNA